MSGYAARENPSVGVHDPLSAKALVLDDGTLTIAIVSVDLLNVSRELTAGVRERVAASDATVDEIFLAATHTHEGPYIPTAAIELTPLLALDEDVSETVEMIESNCADCVLEAYERREPATVRVGVAENDSTAVNRRAADGRGRIPTGGVDPELTVLLVESESGRETVIFHFACHPVCLTPSHRELSADWPGVVYDRVRNARNCETVMFLNSAAGDVNPRGRMAESRPGEVGYDYVETIGAEIAETVLEAATDAEAGPPIAAPHLTTHWQELQLPTKRLGDEASLRKHLSAVEERVERLRQAGDSAALGPAKTDVRYTEQLLRLAESETNELSATVAYLRLGSVGILGVPGEPFVEHGLEFKAHATTDILLPTGYSNGYVGYMPTLAELENFGYEVWSSNLAPEGIVEWRETVLDLI